MIRLLAICALLLLPVAAWAQADDEDGGGFLERLIEDNLSSAGRRVQITGFEGALSSRAVLDELTIADDQGVWLTLRGAVLDWNRSALLQGRLEVSELSAEELILPRLPEFGAGTPSAAAPGFSLPELPVSVEIGRLAIGRAGLGEALFGEAAEITLDGSVSLIEGQGEARLEVVRIDGKRGTVRLAASYSNATQDLTLDLAVSEEADGIAVNLLDIPGRPSVDLSIDGTGTINDFAADIRLDTDGVTRLAGAVTLSAEPRGEGPPLRRFTADIGGDLAPLFTPQYRRFFGDDIRLVARGVRRPDGAVSLEQLTLRAQSLTLEGQVAIGANGLPETIALTGEIADPEGGPVRLPVGANPIDVIRVDLEVAFDVAQGEDWGATVNLIGLDTEGLNAANVTLGGTGVIAENADGDSRVTADITFAAQGLDLDEPEITQALGTEITGKAAIDWQQGTPVRITGLELAGAGVALTGSGTLDIEGADLAATGSVVARVEELAPFSGLAGRELDGSVEARLSGSGGLLGGAFDIEATARGQDLAVSVPQLDPLLRGASFVELSALRDETGLTIRRLTVQSPEVNARLSGQVQEDAGRFEATASLREVNLVLPELSGPLEFNATAERTLDIWQVLADARGPGAAVVSVDGDLRGLPEAPVFDGAVTADIGELGVYSELAGRDLGGAVTGRATGTAALDGSAFDLELAFTSRNLMIDLPQADALLAGEARVEMEVTRDEDAIRVGRLKIDSPQVTGTASGRYLPGSSAVTLDVQLAEAALVLPQLAGPLGLAGTAEERDGGWDVDIDATGPGAAAVSVDGLFSDLDGDPAFDGEVTADIQDLSPYSGLANRDLAGALTARAEGRARLSGDSFDIELSAISRDLDLDITQARPLLAGQATLDLIAARDGDAITVERLALTSPVLTVSGSGALGEDEGALGLTASITDTALLYPQMSGPAALTLKAGREGEGWRLDLNATGPGAAEVTVAGLVTDPLGKPAFDGTVEADIGDLRPFSALAGRSLGGAVDATVTGQFDSADTSYDFDLTAATSNLSLGLAEADQLLGGNARYDASVRGRGSAVVIERLVVETPQLSATISGDTDGEAIDLTLDIRLANLGLFAPGIEGPLQATGTARQEGGRWTVDLDANGPVGSSASVSGSLAADFAGADLGVSGQVPLALANRFIMPNSVTGTASFDLRLDGPLAPASLSGTVSVAQGRAVLPKPELVFDDIGGTVSLGGGQANVSLSAAPQDGGRIIIDGPVSLQPPFNANVVVRLASVVFTDPDLYETTIDGTLTATGPLAGGARLEGTLNLGRTEIQIPSTGLGKAGPIPEITHLNEPAAVRATRARAGLLGRDDDDPGANGPGPRYPIDVQIVAANQIFIRGRGLDAELGGSLRLTGTTADLVPSGQFRLVRGRLDILGKRLVLDVGLLTLQGSFQPFIRLVASTEVDDTRILITIEGEARDPTITFSSEPELPQDEVLARLLFGRGVQQISALQAAQLASAVATLAGRGGGGIINTLRENFGLDDLDLTTDEEGNTAVRLGKYLGENVYTDVTVGSDSTEINLNLDISRTVTAKGSVSSTGETSLGIFFQRDY